MRNYANANHGTRSASDFGYHRKITRATRKFVKNILSKDIFHYALHDNDFYGYKCIL